MKQNDKAWIPAIIVGVFAAVILCIAYLGGCGSLGSDPIQGSIILIWTAPGDDAAMGTATAYDGQYSLSTDSLINHWDGCRVWPVVPTPKPSGQRDSATFDLSVYTEVSYYFAIKTVDDAGNWASISNICEKVWPDTLAPLAVSDLECF